MCGIAGIVLSDGMADPVELDGMLHSLSHRGPDGASRDVVAGFGHTRLAIIDLETGDQPFKTESGHRLVANGEIYNYLELRSSLGEE